MSNVTARVGYGGGFGTGPDGLVCYHGHFAGTNANPPAGSTYGDLGYAEASQVTLDGDPDLAVAQFTTLAHQYFSDGFVQQPNGQMLRKDPNDIGAEYRNVIGIPGGVRNSVLFPILQQQNVYNMTLYPGANFTCGWRFCVDTFLLSARAFVPDSNWAGHL